MLKVTKAINAFLVTAAFFWFFESEVMDAIAYLFDTGDDGFSQPLVTLLIFTLLLISMSASYAVMIIYSRLLKDRSIIYHALCTITFYCGVELILCSNTGCPFDFNILNTIKRARAGDCGCYSDQESTVSLHNKTMKDNGINSLLFGKASDV